MLCHGEASFVLKPAVIEEVDLISRALPETDRPLEPQELVPGEGRRRSPLRASRNAQEDTRGAGPSRSSATTIAHTSLDTGTAESCHPAVCLTTPGIQRRGTSRGRCNAGLDGDPPAASGDGCSNTRLTSIPQPAPC